MQLARTLWLGPERGWSRKIPETFCCTWSEAWRGQIFEYYANSIYVGNQAAFRFTASRRA
jgi:membrane peptidoglycan carboxypeptidase